MDGDGAGWAYLRDSGELCQVIGCAEVWGEKISQIYLPHRNEVRRVREELLAPTPEKSGRTSPHEIVYRAAAARIADALEQDVLVAPLRGSLVPLPHQIYALSRAMAGGTVRYLLADEVGLGKTIEAGLILKELKVRGLIRRILVVAPAGLLDQWVQEMRTHFEEDFRVIRPADFDAVRQVSGLSGRDNVWEFHDQVVCSVDSVKPVESRQGWSREQTARHNRERFEDLIGAGWDLVIVDEAHRLGGSSDQVARYQLGEALAQSTPYLLLLSATPHQGKTDAFRRLLSHLDPDAFPDDESVKRDRVEPYVIRTEKRRAIDAEREPLFVPREVRLLPVEWGEARAEQRALYEAVTEYVRDGYNQALREKQTAVGFLMILMQRLVTSSTRAIRKALERRLEVLELPEGQLSLFGQTIVERAGSLYSRSRAAAEKHGAPLYSELDSAHQERLERERAKLEDSFAARRRAIDRIGLEQVRQHRRAQLEREYDSTRRDLAARENPVPDLSAIQLIRVRSRESS